jgi:hypothetical protein
VRRYRGQQWGVEGVPGGHQDEPSIRGGLHELGHHLSGRIPHEVSFPRRNVRIGKTMRQRPCGPCALQPHAAICMLPHLFACTHACAAMCMWNHVAMCMPGHEAEEREAEGLQGREQARVARSEGLRGDKQRP